MRRTALLAILLLAGIAAAAQDYTKYVNPFVGTDFHGHTFPGAAWPFGMVQLSPDTRPMPGNWDGCSGYHYSDEYIYGFSHTHLSGTGCDDLCDILFVPVRDYDGSMDKERYRSHFSHAQEKAEPGYYEVYLEDPGVTASLTVGRRSGQHRYKFAKGAEPQIIIDLEHRDYLLESDIRKTGAASVSGFRKSKSWADGQDVYFWAEFSEPVESIRTFSKEDGTHKGAHIYFKRSKSNTIYVRVGISSVSTENARQNLEADIAATAGNGSFAKSFDKARAAAKEAWNGFLSQIAVSGGTEEQMRNFYTALYHTAIHPSLYSDVNGEYRGMDRQVHRAEGFERYTVFSIWDTFRALHPLFCLIERERTADFLKSFQSVYDECGKLPIWELHGYETNCMIGYNSVSVIADALSKGIGGVDYNALLEAMVASSKKHEYGLDSFYEDRAVIADKEHESVSKTLEYAYDAWCVAKTAGALGKEGTRDEYLGYASYWRNIFDPSTGFMRPRLNGRWLTPFNPREVNNHFTEANSWQYSFFVPQDISGHMAALGGEEGYAAKLDSLFDAPEETAGRTQADITGQIGQYAHGNEPSHHIPYLYNYAGKPWKTQERVRQILATLYTSAPDGLCGNEDCGQMSAWYVLSALGLYNVCPGQNEICLSSPIFRKAEIRIKDGKVFTITADHPEKAYISSARLNGASYTRSYVDAGAILDGGQLDYMLSDTPSGVFGTSDADRPHSGLASGVLPSPAFEMENDIFLEPVSVSISGAPEGSEILYRIFPAGSQDTDSTEGFVPYEGPFTLKENCTVRAFVRKDGQTSAVTSCTVHKIHNDMRIKLGARYNRQYNAGGDEGLIDGYRGTTNWRTGGWQGYQDTDFTAVVELLEPRMLEEIGAGFCQDARSWIWMPRYVEFSVSGDGENFVPVGRVDNTTDPQDYVVQVRDMSVNVPVSTGPVRFIKVFAKNFGTIPEWHPGAGGEGFIFIDEIWVKDAEGASGPFLFIGDSITDGGWGNSGGTMAPSSERNHTDWNHIYGHSYMMLCASDLQSRYPEGELVFYNRGISGDTVPGLLKRWDGDALALNPGTLTLLVGINDAMQRNFDIEAWEAGYRQLLDRTRKALPDCRIVLCTPFFAKVGGHGRRRDADTVLGRVRAEASVVRSLAAEYGATLVPFDELFDGLVPSGPSETYWIWDGIHPTPAGHRRMADLWESLVKN